MDTRRQISRICWAYTAFLAASTAAQLLFGALLELFVLIFGGEPCVYACGSSGVRICYVRNRISVVCLADGTNSVL